MPIEILMPALSPTMKEGNLAKWLKKEGDKVSAGDVIAEIETDKATMEVEAIDDGVLGKILVAEGSQGVKVNQLIALLLEDGEDKSSLASYKEKSVSDANKADDLKKSDEVKKDENSTKKNVTVAKGAEKTTSSYSYVPQQNTENRDNSGRIKASPLAKRIATKNNIDISQIFGSGPGGRVIKNDVMNFNKNPNRKDGNVRRINEEYKEIANNNIRKIIASKLAEAKRDIPHFYLNIEVNFDKLLDVRSQINSLANLDEKNMPSYKVSVNDMVIKASALALAEVPQANSSWGEEAVKIYNNIDISIAVAAENGLITPIIKNADQKDLFTISKEAKSLIKKAQLNKLTPEEFQGGSFSISNLGMYGIKQFNAIINPPQACILAVGASIKKPFVNDADEIKIASIVNFTLSCDHRAVDGAIAAKFLQSLKKYIENPALILI